MFVENKLNRCQTKHALILCFVEEDSNSICSTQGNQFKRIILQMILKWLSVETKYRNKIFSITMATVQLHPHWWPGIPSEHQKSDVTCSDCWAQVMWNNSARVCVSTELLIK